VSTPPPKHWGLWTLAMMVVAISPFWIMAADIRDGDEVEKTAVGAGVSSIVFAISQLIGKFMGAK